MTRQTRFASEYVANGGNAAAAAKAVGYKNAQSGSALLREIKVQQEIAVIADRVAKKYALTVDLAAANIYREMTFDPASLYHADGTTKSLHELDADTRLALASVDVDEDGTTRYKWASKTAARNDLMKHLGMFERDNVQKGESLSLLIKLV